MTPVQLRHRQRCGPQSAEQEVSIALYVWVLHHACTHPRLHAAEQELLRSPRGSEARASLQSLVREALHGLHHEPSPHGQVRELDREQLRLTAQRDHAAAAHQRRQREEDTSEGTSVEEAVSQVLETRRGAHEELMQVSAAVRHCCARTCSLATL